MQTPIRTAAEIRQQFIDFFVERHGHTEVTSSPVVPHDDPTLLFANAGMNQFKDVFLGAGQRDYRRAVNSQKCIRAGGKHNDLEDVGKDSYHHTFFEMLGNWSFGDYFKEEAIRYTWELLTDVWGLEKSRLYVTVFGGDAAENLPADEESEKFWQTVTDIDHTHISRWGKKDNFWEMGATGPCGPCTEIHYDFTDDLSGGHLVNADDERVIEIWNNVFIQFNRDEEGRLTPLPAQHVDTGMGFERIVRILQGKRSNYDIDLWMPIFIAIEQRSGARAYGGRTDDAIDIAYRVIADHVRCLTFAITDGALPGNEGRGYVLRRILRRAVRHARQTLGVQTAFLHEVVPAVVESMGAAYPEIRAAAEKVAEVIHAEEESFGRTLNRGLALFDTAAMQCLADDIKQIDAADAFMLHDTFGFPIDLTEVMAEERGMTVDLEGYRKLMDEARAKARAGGGAGAASAGGSSGLSFSGDEAARLKHLNIAETDDSPKFECKPLRARIKAIWNGRDFDEHTTSADAQHLVAIITNKTNFYAEMGGQVGDKGTIIDGSNGTEFEVLETTTFGGYVLHIGHTIKGRLSVGEAVELEIDLKRRQPTMANHTGTHLLNLALHEILGAQVNQKGSMVGPERLRFDYAHGKTLTTEEAEAITTKVEAQIAADHQVFAAEADLEAARKITGLRAVFGERYPHPVRVVSIGIPVDNLMKTPENQEWGGYSIEFCGGTHVLRTGAVGGFAIIAEESVARGVRRIVALTGGAAVEARAAARELSETLNKIATLDESELPVGVTMATVQIEEFIIPYADRRKLRAELALLQDRVKILRKNAAKAGRAEVVEQARAIADALASDSEVVVAELIAASADGLRSGMDVITDRHPQCAILLMGGDQAAGKVAIVAKVPEDLIDRGLKAGDWIRAVAKICGGGGGGRPDMAQAGGKDTSKIPAALTHAKQFAGEALAHD